MIAIIYPPLHQERGIFYACEIRMIISASRRSDIPAFYMDWFLERLRQGFVLVRNPMNPRQVSRVDLTPAQVDCIVFWTKNPHPMLDKLPEIESYPYYVQFTINPYESDLEANLPAKQTLLDTFRKLADRIGPERMVWRYSPVIFTDRYDEDRHLAFFGNVADRLAGYTGKCNLAFLDIYAKIRKNMRALGVKEASEEVKNRMAGAFHAIARRAGMRLGACGNIDLDAAGVPKACCVDAELIERLVRRCMPYRKDPGQRPDCYCSVSVDVGAYNTCANGCRYCYANHSPDLAARRLENHDSLSPLLCDVLKPDDIVTVRKAGRR